MAGGETNRDEISPFPTMRLQFQPSSLALSQIETKTSVYSQGVLTGMYYDMFALAGAACT